MISPETTADEKVKLAFLLCDVDASGGVSLSNLLSLIGYAQNHDIKVPSVTAASPKSDDASAAAPKQPPMLKRSATSMSRAFDAYDDSGEGALFDQFRAFLKANLDVLSFTALLQDKLKNAELLADEDAVNRIKQERTERKGREGRHGRRSFGRSHFSNLAGVHVSGRSRRVRLGVLSHRIGP